MPRLLALAVAVGLLACTVSSPAFAARAGAGRVLERSLPEMKFTGVALGEALDFLRDVSDANIHVNWKALEAANVTPDTPINIRLRTVTLRKVLGLLLSEAGGGDTLTYYVEEGVIEVTTKELADKRVFTRVYPVDDLIMDIPDFVGPEMSLQASGDSNSGGGGGSGGGSSGGGLFDQQNEGDDDEDKGKSKTERGEDLVSLIKETIQPDVWVDNGGTASIRFFNGSLVITAPRSVHEAIGGAWD